VNGRDDWVQKVVNFNLLITNIDLLILISIALSGGQKTSPGDKSLGLYCLLKWSV